MRPDGWDAEKIAQSTVTSQAYNDAPIASIKLVEAGADAYEEGLKKQAWRLVKDNIVHLSEDGGSLIRGKNGYLVFIEEAVEVGGEIVNVGDDRPPTVTTKGPDGNSH